VFFPGKREAIRGLLGAHAVSSLAGYAAGLAVLALAAALARRRGALDAGGVAAALAIGLVLLAASWVALALMIAFFASSTALTFYRYREKERVGAAEKKGGRSAAQVLCSGGVPAAVAAASLLAPEQGARLLFAAASAIAYANADTWAAELGSLSGTRPRLIVKPRVRVPPGVSGGVTPLGEVGAASGSALIALAYYAMTGGNALAVFLLGWAGEVVDAALGALFQVKYVCPKCGVLWDHPVHVCGSETAYLRGFKWMKNEVVNLVTELAVVSAALLTSLHP
jgi:uncharacterized protein (TIGR00297 family)